MGARAGAAGGAAGGAEAGPIGNGQRPDEWHAAPARPLEGVCIVVSGIVNPERGELRDMALHLGAGYRGEWVSEATHVLAAFDGTDKTSAVISESRVFLKVSPCNPPSNGSAEAFAHGARSAVEG